MRGGSKAPILQAIMAALFCTFNGFLQSHTILYVVPFEREEYKAPTFILGKNLTFIR